MVLCINLSDPFFSKIYSSQAKQISVEEAMQLFFDENDSEQAGRRD